MKTRKGLRKELLNQNEWKGLELHYRNKRSCIIYVEKDFKELYIDTPNDNETIYTQDIYNRGFSELIYAIISYLRITKVILRKDRAARRFINSVLKNYFRFENKLFGEFFDNRGEINWNKVMSVTNLHLDEIKFLIYDGNDWKGYKPFRTYKQ